VTSPAGSGRTVAGYLLGPAIFTVALAIAVLPTALHIPIPSVGPFDETVVWWTVLLPAAVLVPWAVAVGEPLAGRHVRRRVTAGLAIVVVAMLAVPLATSNPPIGCDPDPGLIRVLGATAAVVAAGTGGFVATVIASAHTIGRPAAAIAVSAVGTIATTFGTILAFAVVFGAGVSCAYVPRP
jgi:hypothetical protein